MLLYLVLYVIKLLSNGLITVSWTPHAVLNNIIIEKVFEVFGKLLNTNTTHNNVLYPFLGSECKFIFALNNITNILCCFSFKIMEMCPHQRYVKNGVRQDINNYRLIVVSSTSAKFLDMLYKFGYFGQWLAD